MYGSQNLNSIKRFVLYLVFFVFCFTDIAMYSAQAQSMIEYATLTTAAGASGAASGSDKDKAASGSASAASKVVDGAVNKLYGESSSVMAKGSELLKQAGGGVLTQGQGAEKASAPERGPVRAKIIEFKKEEESPDDIIQAVPGAMMVRVNLKDGGSSDGALIEHTNEYVRIEVAGLPITYFAEQIDSIEQIQG